MSPPGSHRREADVLRQALARHQAGLGSGLGPTGEFAPRSAKGPP